MSDITEDGLRFSETKKERRNSRGDIVQTPRVVLFKWSEELRKAVTEIRRLTRHDSKIESLYLFPNRGGGRCSLGSFNQAWQKLRPDMKLAGLEPFQPRDVRAKYASDLKLLGRDVQESLGHSDAKTTEDHYLRDDIILEPSR
ncbi:MAG: tyrosine-type recombinase/integrase [Gammaproteobacteria bacterium]|nr:tyrosine-type recombinase/integrase [Gammaproteobacteria bacterium]